jgi:CheY-like chemotaxis protein
MMLYKNILLIDDDIDDAEIFAEAVNSLKKGILFNASNNPVKALEELKSSDNLPDLIFLDYNMPLINGQELLRKIKNEERLKDIAIILISSPTEEFVKGLLQNKDIVNYIKKPNSFPELVAILKEIL